jgi:Phage integrase family
MKKRFWLWRRNGVFYLQDAETRQKESLHTRDRREAERLRDARNDAAARPVLGMALAKAYLSAHDAEIAKRTWQNVMDYFCARGKPQTQERRLRAARSKCYDRLRSLKLLETNANDFLAVLENGGVMAHSYLRCLHNLAIGLGWLPWPVLPTKLWPALQVKSKRGITAEEHQRVLSTEKNRERRLYYELVWEIGASQTDAALLTAENINWTERVLSYQRQKTGTWSYIKIGSRLEILLRQLPSQGLLFPNWGKVSNGDRAAEFRRRCRILNIEGISLHSYRYAWAERAKCAGYPERFAMQNLGHNSSAVTRAYAKKAHVILPPLEEYETKIIPPRSQDVERNGVQKNGMGV